MSEREEGMRGRRIRPGALRMSLLGGFQLEDVDAKLILPEGSQRLLAFLALKGRSVRRRTVAGTLWPIASEDRANSSLRSALARLDAGARAAVEATAKDLRLADDVTVDLWDTRSIAHHLLEQTQGSGTDNLGSGAISALSNELLPDWYDEWVLVESEDWRQLRLHALEALAESLTKIEEFAGAAEAALAAVRAEPLRESPRAAMIRVHIAEGNPTEALREFDRYGELLMLELGVEPTERLRALVTDLWTVARP
ncbi:MAG TPA: BTAD domain-containing putative transcriptional regulator [Actinomycetota bacterium]|nr:BTAD domain-containing putative transcriptional regulator [Actinomycetota bacterium]